MQVLSTLLLQIGDNTYMYTGTKKEKAQKEKVDVPEGGASTTEDEDDDMLGDEAVLISRSAEDVDEAQVRESKARSIGIRYCHPKRSQILDN